MNGVLSAFDERHGLHPRPAAKGDRPMKRCKTDTQATVPVTALLEILDWLDACPLKGEPDDGVHCRAFRALLRWADDSELMGVLTEEREGGTP